MGVDAIEALCPLFALVLRCALTTASPPAQSAATLAAKLTPIINSLPCGGRVATLQFELAAWTERCRAVVSAERCTFFLHDAREKQLLAFVQGSAEPLKVDLEDDTVVSALTISATERVSVNIQRPSMDARFNAELDGASGFTTHSVLAVPFESVARGGLLGVCHVLNKRVGGQYITFTQKDEEVLDATLRLVALSVENAQLVDDCTLAQRKQLEGKSGSNLMGRR